MSNVLERGEEGGEEEGRWKVKEGKRGGGGVGEKRRERRRGRGGGEVGK